MDEDFSGKLESSEIDGRGDAITKLNKQKISIRKQEDKNLSYTAFKIFG